MGEERWKSGAMGRIRCFVDCVSVNSVLFIVLSRVYLNGTDIR